MAAAPARLGPRPILEAWRSGGGSLTAHCGSSREADFIACSAHRAGRHPPRAHAAAVGPSVRLHCGARAGVVPHNSLRAARCAQTDAASMRTKRAARADPGAALLAAAEIAPAGCRLSRGRGRACFRPNTPSAATKTGLGRSRCACEAPRSAGPMASARSAPRALTSSRLFERSERSSRSELATRPWDRAPQGSRRQPTASAKRRGLPRHGFAALTSTQTADFEVQPCAETCPWASASKATSHQPFRCL